MFEWIKDKTFYKKRCNKMELELELQRKAHAQNTIAWTKQIEDFKASEEYKTTKIKLANKTIKELKERIKELETPEKEK